jgi:hypothetical protein
MEGSGSAQIITDPGGPNTGPTDPEHRLVGTHLFGKTVRAEYSATMATVGLLLPP